MKSNVKKKLRRPLMALSVAGILLVSLVPAGQASGTSHNAKWWLADPGTSNGSWRESPKLVQAYRRWQEKYPDATDHDDNNEQAMLQQRYVDAHYHEALSSQNGTASWFSGRHGACTPHMSGYYAASRTLPCGSVVSVRSGDNYVFVTIQDRGPYAGRNRILDLSKSAFRQLAPLGSGVIHVKSVRIKP